MFSTSLEKIIDKLARYNAVKNNFRKKDKKIFNKPLALKSTLRLKLFL